jgi:hypothetical protein
LEYQRSDLLVQRSPYGGKNVARYSRVRLRTERVDARQLRRFGDRVSRPSSQEGVEMLWTIFVILLILWLLGLVSSYTLGGFIHILLVVALVILVFNLLSGRRTAL